MAQSATELANLALALLGGYPPALTDVATDISKEAKLCQLFLDPARKSLLRLFPWNFAVKRETLTLGQITGMVNNGAGLIRVTKTAHGFSTSDVVSISEAQGTTEANGIWTITSINSNTFDLQGSTFINTYVSGGYVSIYPGFEYAHRHSLPSTFLRLIKLETPKFTTVDYRIESGYVVTDAPILEMKYVQEITDYTKMDPLFYRALCHFLAMDVCYPLTQSKSLKEQVIEEYKAVIREARFVDSIEDPMKSFKTDTYLSAREGNENDFVRDPMTN